MAGFSADRVGNKLSLGSAVTHHIQCSLCHHIFNEPLVTQCGHTFCYHCLDEWAKTDTACPECQIQLTTGGGEVVIGGGRVSAARNRLAADIVNDLMIACENRKKGCVGVMPPTALAAHHESCPHRSSQQSVANYLIPLDVKNEDVEIIVLDEEPPPSQPMAVVIVEPPLRPPPLQLPPPLRSTRAKGGNRSTTTIETSVPIVPSPPPPPSTSERSLVETPVRARVGTKQSAKDLARKADRESCRVGDVFQCQKCPKSFKKYQSLVGHCARKRH